MPPRTRPRWIPASPAITAARWLDMLACGAVAGSAVLLLLALLARPLASLIAATLGPWTAQKAAVLLLAGSVVAMALLWRHGKGRWGARGGWRHPLWYPGLLPAVLVGLLVAGYGQSFLNGRLDSRWIIEGASSVAALPRWAVLGMSLVFGLPVIADVLWRMLPSRDGRAKGDAARPLPEDIGTWTLADWRRWSASDREIRFKGDDQFDAHPIAKRVADRLRDREEDERPSIALVGPKGSGKSSILEMVAQELATEKDIEIIRVSLWPFDSAEAAMRGVLGQLIERVGQHAPTLGLTSLPAKYLAAVDHMAGRWGVLRFLAAPEADPAKLIQHIETIAAATGVRFVLAIEDFERFHVGDAESGSLGPIRALLHLLDRCQRVIVVMASQDLDDGFDIDKIARFVERTPTIDADRIARLLHLFRAACLSSDTAIIDAGDGHRLDFDPSEGKRMAHLASHGERALLVEEAVLILADTPRTLKFAIRRACEVWGRLPGEIDVDELLVLSVLRECEPEVYAAFTKTDVLRGLRSLSWRKLNNKELRGTENLAYSSLHASITEVQGDERQEAVWRLAAFLFPGLSPFKGKSPPQEEWSKGPQRIWASEPTDYLHRFESMPEIPHGERDQDVIGDIDAWRANDNNGLLDRVRDPKRASQVVQFSGRFSEPTALRLFEMVVRADAETGVIGIAAVRQILSEIRPDWVDIQASLNRIRSTVVANNILLADVLFGRDGLRRYLRIKTTREEMQRATNQLVGAFIDAFLPDQYSKLDHAMREAGPEALFDMVSHPRWRVPRLGETNPSLPLDQSQWDGIGPFLLRYAVHNPQVGAVVVAWCIAYQYDIEEARQRTGSVYAAEVNDHVASTLFDRSTLVEIFKQCSFARDGMEPMDRVRLEAAINWANAQPDPHPQEPPE
jgi:hypothetical protein